MNIQIFLLLLLFPFSGCAQSSIKWQKVDFDKQEAFEIESEDGIYLSDFNEPNDTIRAAIQVANDERTFSKIKLSSAKFVNDTLRITLHTTTPAYHHVYEIIVANGKYFIKYRFAGGGGMFDEILEPIETKLMLNTNSFQRGQVIRGYTLFKANCVYPCSNGIFVASGNFKAFIR